VFEKLTGRDIYDALETDLARPIGMQDFDRSLQKKRDAKRSIYPAYPMHLSTRDMARLGYLMLRGGNWNGRRLVPKGDTHARRRRTLRQQLHSVVVRLLVVRLFGWGKQSLECEAHLQL
jgi:CubicO group peptidase (beta-lactamase class C family)